MTKLVLTYNNSSVTYQRLWVKCAADKIVQELRDVRRVLAGGDKAIITAWSAGGGVNSGYNDKLNLPAHLLAQQYAVW